MARQLLFSVTRKDLRVDTFKAGGPGGQNQNKRETGVRITHIASGAVGVSRETRSQAQNQYLAFTQMVNSHKFKAWHKIEVARHVGALAAIEAEVDRAMIPRNIRVETRQGGKWVEEA